MTTWRALDDELALWAAARRPTNLWWRDDDASGAVAALERLMALAEKWRAPIGVAAIPASATLEAVKRVSAWHGAAILQHGFTHRNHARDGEKKNEFPSSRTPTMRAGDLRAGRDRLIALAGERFLPVFVPPWNRMAEDTVDGFGSAGLLGLSRDKPRRAREAAPPIVQANVHVDPIDWQNGKHFVGEAPALGMIVGHLAAKRRGDVDSNEPIGLVTHHLVQDDATWAFVEALLSRVASTLLAPAEVFAIP